MPPTLHEIFIAGDWDSNRLQFAWDAIALHTTMSIAVSHFPTPLFLFQGPIRSYETISEDDRVLQRLRTPSSSQRGMLSWTISSGTRDPRLSPGVMESTLISPDLIGQLAGI